MAYGAKWKSLQATAVGKWAYPAVPVVYADEKNICGLLWYIYPSIHLFVSGKAHRNNKKETQRNTKKHKQDSWYILQKQMRWILLYFVEILHKNFWQTRNF